MKKNRNEFEVVEDEVPMVEDEAPIGVETVDAGAQGTAKSWHQRNREKQLALHEAGLKVYADLLRKYPDLSQEARDFFDTFLSKKSVAPAVSVDAFFAPGTDVAAEKISTLPFADIYMATGLGYREVKARLTKKFGTAKIIVLKTPEGVQIGTAEFLKQSVFELTNAPASAAEPVEQ